MLPFRFQQVPRIPYMLQILAAHATKKQQKSTDNESSFCGNQFPLVAFLGVCSLNPSFATSTSWLPPGHLATRPHSACNKPRNMPLICHKFVVVVVKTNTPSGAFLAYMETSVVGSPMKLTQSVAVPHVIKMGRQIENRERRGVWRIEVDKS